MKDTNPKNTGVNPVVSGVVGAVAGAGVAVAATMALKDEKNREKVKEVLIDAKDQVVKYIDDVQSHVSTQVHTAKKTLADDAKKGEKMVNSAAHKVRDEAQKHIKK